MENQIVKSNHVIEAGYRLTLNEQRLVLLCIQQIKKGQAITPTTGFNVTVNDFMELFGVSSKNAYSDLKEVTDVLFNRSLTIYQPDPEEPKLESTKTRWISAIDYIPNEGRVRLYFAPKVIPYISLLELGFTRYNLTYIAKMTSVYGLRFYELFKCWLMGEKTKVKTIELDKLKELLDIGGQYASIKDFKMYVVERGLADVNEHTDLNVTCENKKTGRKITGLIFTIQTKLQKITVNNPALRKNEEHILPSTKPTQEAELAKAEPSEAIKRANALSAFVHWSSMAKQSGMSIEQLANKEELAAFKKYRFI